MDGKIECDCCNIKERNSLYLLPNMKKYFLCVECNRSLWKLINSGIVEINHV